MKKIRTIAIGLSLLLIVSACGNDGPMEEEPNMEQNKQQEMDAPEADGNGDSGAGMENSLSMPFSEKES